MQVQIPSFEISEVAPRTTKYCLCIPIINEGERIITQLEEMKSEGIDRLADVIICDGGSTDGSTDIDLLGRLGVNTLLVKTGAGKLSAQLRMGYWWALERGYEGVITMDGNCKDSICSVPLFIEKLDAGYDMVQGSRYIPGGMAINSPLARELGSKLVHAPGISLAAHFKFTDTTNGFRGYSRRYLTHLQVQPFRDIFDTYELLAYLSVRANQIGLKTIEVPVTRAYPKTGKTPTKISFLRGNLNLLRILFRTMAGRYNPRNT